MAKGLIANELRVASEEELDSKLADAKIELFNLRFQAATGQLESHGRLRAVRKEIARIYTVKRERELGIVVVADEDYENYSGAGADAPEAVDEAAVAVDETTVDADEAQQEEAADE